MQIIVANTAGQKYTYQVDEKDTVLSVKHKVAQDVGHPVDHVHLIFAGKQLENGKKLKEEEVKDGKTLHLLIADNNSTGTEKSVSPLGITPTIGSTSPTKGGVINYDQAVFELDNNKWFVRGFRNGNVTIDKAEMHHAIVISDCLDTVINISAPKVNHIMIDRCTNTRVLYNSAISAVEVVHCKNISTASTGIAPSVVIDLTEGAHFYYKSTIEGVTTIKFIAASCSDIYVYLEDKDLRFHVPTSVLTDQMASRISFSKKAQRYVMKTLHTYDSTSREPQIPNLSLLDSTDQLYK